MSILAIGLSVYDITLSLEEELIIDQKYRVRERYECVGGQASNAACVCAKWQKETYMLSRIGDDASGRAILASYDEVGLKCDHVKMLPRFSTSSSVIINHRDSGKRTILNHQDKIEEIDFDLPKKAEYILFDAHEESAAIDAIAKFPDAIKMLDAERASAFTLKLAPDMDYIVGSEVFAKEYTNLDVIDENYEAIVHKIKSLNHKNVVITLGERGLIYEENNMVKQVPAFNVKVVDTTGAGDIFHGALLYAISEQMKWQDSLVFASIASALSVQKQGGFTSIPTLKEIKDAWNTYKNTGTI